MADKPPVLPILPRNMRPRSTQRAEENAQKGDAFRNSPEGQALIEQGQEALRNKYGYARGGKVAPNNRFGFATPGRYTKR